MKAKVYITLKRGVLDPQGKAVQSGLEHLGFKGIKDVRVGKLIEIELDGLNIEEAQKSVKEMCESLLANTVIEDYCFEIDEGAEKITDKCILSEGRIIA